MITSEVDSQYYLNITTLTATTQQLQRATVIEYAGIRPPEVEIAYLTTDPDEIGKLTVDTKVSMTLSRTKDDLSQPLDLYIVDVAQIKSTSSEYVITVTLTASPPSFRAVALSEAYNTTSTDAIAQIAAASKFHVNKNIRTTDDIMTWIRTSTARDFLAHVWRYSYMPNSTMLLAFDITNTLTITDTKTLANTKPVATLSYAQSSLSTDLQLAGEIAVISRQGSIGHVAASGRKQDTYHVTAGTQALQANITPSLLSSSRKLQPNTNSVKPVILDNTHANYAQAFLDNKASLAQLSLLEYPAMLVAKWADIKPLDIVNVLETTNTNTHQVNASNGHYIVQRTIREITSESMETTLLLNREALNVV